MITGLSTNISMMIADKTKSDQIESISKQVQHERAITYFKENIGNVMTVEDFVNDYKLYSFTMKAFGLEDQIFGKAMMKKILSSDISDEKSLINRMTDSRFRAIYKYMDFKYEGTANFNTFVKSWQDGVVDKYLEVQFEARQFESSESVGLGLAFERKASSMKTWYHVIADPEFAKTLQVALALPSSMSNMPVEKQKALYESKMSISTLQDPEKVYGLRQKFGALYDAQNASSTANISNPALSIMSDAAARAGYFNPVTIDISSVAFANLAAYRRGNI